MKHRWHWSTRWGVTFLAAVAISLAADIILLATDNRDHYIWGDELVGYWALFGAFWYAVITAVYKLLGHLLIQRPEDYYEAGGEHPPEEERSHG